MPTSTYIALANITLGSSASSVTFSSIPATYRDLVLVVDGAMASAGAFSLRINSDSGTNYPQMMMRAEASSTSSSDPSSGQLFYGSWSTVETSQRYQGVWNIMDYSATDKHKTVLLRCFYRTASTTSSEAHAGRWANTAAITSLQVLSGTGSFAATTAISLYGISA